MGLVELDFRKDDLRLSVSDDGTDLPDDYAEHGHGFSNKPAGAERLGGDALTWNSEGRREVRARPA